MSEEAKAQQQGQQAQNKNAQPNDKVLTQELKTGGAQVTEKVANLVGRSQKKGRVTASALEAVRKENAEKQAEANLEAARKVANEVFDLANKLKQERAQFNAAEDKIIKELTKKVKEILVAEGKYPTISDVPNNIAGDLVDGIMSDEEPEPEESTDESDEKSED